MSERAHKDNNTTSEKLSSKDDSTASQRKIQTKATKKNN